MSIEGLLRCFHEYEWVAYLIILKFKPSEGITSQEWKRIILGSFRPVVLCSWC